MSPFCRGRRLPLVGIMMLLIGAGWCATAVKHSMPRILKHPENDYVVKNEPATLDCKATGSPPPTITWYRNGRPVVTANEDPLTHRMLLPSGQLFFLRVIHNKNNKPDVGVYYCNATNIVGSAISREATLEIAVLRDDFREMPQDTTVAVGEMAMLRCSPPRGEPEPRVIWMKNSEQLQTSSRVTVLNSGDLRISSAQKIDSGVYNCKAMNAAGERISPPATLSVQVKPSFTVMPEDVVVDEKNDVVLECSASGDPDATILWRKEEGLLPSGRAYLIGNKNLHIEETSVDDEGLYICQAQNPVGSIEAVARLTVHSQPTFIVMPSDKVAGIGRTVTLQCIVAGNPPPAVFWSKGSKQGYIFPKQENGRYSVDQDGTFRIEQVRFEDAGEYVCEALSAAGSAVAKATIEVRGSDPVPPPVIEIGPQNQTVLVNDVAMLQCLSREEPRPTIRWYKNGRPLVANKRITILDSGTLQLSDLQRSDNGMYTCRATSSAGETAWSATLTVEYPSNPNAVVRKTPNMGTFPGTPTKPIITDVTDSTVHLAWRPSENEGASPVSSFIVEYFCYDTGEGWVIASTSITRESFTVRNLQPESSYIFLVRAKNAHGMSQPSAKSDRVRTSGRRGVHAHRPDASHKPRGELEVKLGGDVVELLEAEAINSSVIRLRWKTTRVRSLIDGFNIKYTPLSDPRRPRGDSFIEKIDVPFTSVYRLRNLRGNTWYEVSMQAYGGPVNSHFSNALRVQTYEAAPSAPPTDVVVRRESDTSIQLKWDPPPPDHQNGEIRGYEIFCVGGERKHNCNFSTNGTTSTALVDRLMSGMAYKLRIAARTRMGVGVWSKEFVIDPDQPSIMKEPWFIGMLIGTIGGTLWIALCIFSIWLCRKRRNMKKFGQNGNYSVGVQKPEEQSRNGNMLSREVYGNKDGNMTGFTTMPPDLTNSLDNGNRDTKDGHNIYNTASFPHMKTFYQKPNPVPVTIAPYATTTLINGNNVYNKPPPAVPESAFRPIHQGCCHHSGSGDSCHKQELLPSSDSNTDNSRPNTGTHGSFCNPPLDPNDPGMTSPCSDSGSYTADENGMPVRRMRKQHYQQVAPTMLNWADLLPPPPEHPPPSDIGTPPESPTSTMRYYDQVGRNRSPMSPVSKISACSCPVPHDRLPVCMRSMPYSDTEHRCYSPHVRDLRPYSPKIMNDCRTQSLSHDNRSHSPRTSNVIQYPRGQDYRMYAPRAYHSDQEQGMMPHLQGYKLLPSDGEYRYVSDTEQVPTPPMRGYGPVSQDEPQIRSYGPSSQEGPQMDRACQSSFPSLANECIGPQMLPARLEVTSSGPRLNIDFDGYLHNVDSPISEDMPDYVGESDMDHAHNPECPTPESSAGGDVDGSVTGSMMASWASVTDNSNTSSARSSALSSSDGSFLTEADFASAVARAAELSGLTVVGTTVSDPKAGGKKHHSRRHYRAQRPTSPYSTDSNFSAVPPHKPYPKSQRKKQLIEQGKRQAANQKLRQQQIAASEYQSQGQPQSQGQAATPAASSVTANPSELHESKGPSHSPEGQGRPQDQGQSVEPSVLPPGVADLPAYNKPNFPTSNHPVSSSSKGSGPRQRLGLQPLTAPLANEQSECGKIVRTNPLDKFTMEIGMPVV